MNRAGNEFFSRSVFSRDKNACIGWGNSFNNRKNLIDFLALPEDLPFSFDAFLEFPVLCLKPALLKSVANGYDEFIAVERFWQKIKRAQLRGFDCGLNRTVAGDHHDWKFSIPFTNLLKNLKPIHARHLNIQQDKIRARQDFLKGLLTVLCKEDFVPFILEDHFDGIAYPFFIINDQNGLH